MSRIPLPERGQPLDLSYIYQIANTVNDLAAKLTTSVGRYSTIGTPTSTDINEDVQTSDTRIVARYIEVTNTLSTGPGQEVNFSFNWSGDFRYPPIVTATPKLIGESSTESGKDISVILKDVTVNSVSGIVRFDSIGVASVGINFIVVGIAI